MTTPVRIQLSRRKAFRLADAAENGLPAVRVSRPGKWGNPFNFKPSEHCWTALSFGCRGDARGRQEASVIAFREWITPQPHGRLKSSERQVVMGIGEKTVPIGPLVTAGTPPTIEEIRAELRGKNLACWCRIGEPCHADVLLEIANADDRAGK